MTGPPPGSGPAARASAYEGPAGRAVEPKGDHADQQLDESLIRLRADYPDVAPEVLRSALVEARTALADKPIQDFVPVLAERAARALLRAH